MKILVADGGSTSVKWAYVDSEHPTAWRRLSTPPLNPTHCTDATHVMSVLAALPIQVDRLYFYGSGCTPARIPFMEDCLRSAFPSAVGHIRVESDVIGAARALWPGHSGRGIACILGTGAIAARVDMTKDEVLPFPSLGYILGDEGSGAWLGRHLLSDLLKAQLPEPLQEAFRRNHPEINAANVIEHVYRQPEANRYLASMVPLLMDYGEHPYVEALVSRGFDAFLMRNVRPALQSLTSQHEQREYARELRFVGSVAALFQTPLERAAERQGYRASLVLGDPLSALVADALSRS